MAYNYQYQLDLFEPPPTEFDLIRSDVDQVRTRCDNVRRGLFSRHNLLAKEQLVIKDELAELRAEINRVKLELKNSTR